MYLCHAFIAFVTAEAEEKNKKQQDARTSDKESKRTRVMKNSSLKAELLKLAQDKQMSEQQGEHWFHRH